MERLCLQRHVDENESDSFTDIMHLIRDDIATRMWIWITVTQSMLPLSKKPTID